MRKITSCLMMRYFIIALVITGGFFSGCTSDSSGGSITADDVKGTWIKVWEGEPYNYNPDDENAEADTLIFDIGDSKIEAVFYEDTAQVGGFKGTYTIAGDEMVVSATQTWNEEFDFGDGGLPVWEDPDSPQEYTFPFTPGSSSLTITGPGDTVIVMDKISFSILSDLTGSWEKAQELLRSPARVPSRSSAPAEYTMSLSFLGDYGYVWDTQNGLGKWDASGTDSGYLRTVVKVYTGMEEGGPHTVDWGFLNEYTLDNQPSLTVDIDEAGLTKYVHPAD